MPSCQVQMKAISLQRSEPLNTSDIQQTTCWSAVSNYFINSNYDGTCLKEAVIKGMELTGVHSYQLLSLSLNAILHIRSHFITEKVTQVSMCKMIWSFQIPKTVLHQKRNWCSILLKWDSSLSPILTCKHKCSPSLSPYLHFPHNPPLFIINKKYINLYEWIINVFVISYNFYCEASVTGVNS